MKKYRLKKEAIPFFKEQYATVIRDYAFWEKMNIDFRALKEAEDCFISYGIATGKDCQKMSEWNEDGAQVHFTLHIPKVDFQEYDLLIDKSNIRALMDNIQQQVSRFCSDFLEKQPV